MDFAIDFSENPAIHEEIENLVYKSMKVNTILQVGNISEGFVKTEGYAYAFGAEFKKRSEKAFLMNTQPGNIRSVVLAYEKTLKIQYSPKPKPECIPVIETFLNNHGNNENMSHSRPFKFNILTLILNNVCSDWEETKILLKKMEQFPVMIKVFLPTPSSNTELKKVLGGYSNDFRQDRSGVSQVQMLLPDYPRELFAWNNLHDPRFKERLLKTLFHRNMIPPVNVPQVYEDVERFLSS